MCNPKNNNFLISQLKHKFWVLKRTVLKLMGKKIFKILRKKTCFSKSVFNCKMNYLFLYPSIRTCVLGAQKNRLIVDWEI